MLFTGLILIHEKFGPTAGWLEWAGTILPSLDILGLDILGNSGQQLADLNMRAQHFPGLHMLGNSGQQLAVLNRREPEYKLQVPHE